MVTAGKAVHTTQASWLQWCLQPQVTRQQWEQCLWLCPSNHGDTHNSRPSPLPPVVVPVNPITPNTAEWTCDPHFPPSSPTPCGEQARAWLRRWQTEQKHPLSWSLRQQCQWHQQQQGTRDSKAVTMPALGNTHDRDSRAWKVPTLKYNQSAQVRETKNLCYSATYWKTIERHWLLWMCQQRNNSSSSMKIHSDIVPQKDNDSCPETNLKITEYHNLIENSK